MKIQCPIRDLLWLMTLAAVLVARGLDHDWLRERFENSLDQPRKPESNVVFEIYDPTKL